MKRMLNSMNTWISRSQKNKSSRSSEFTNVVNGSRREINWMAILTILCLIF